MFLVVLELLFLIDPLGRCLGIDASRLAAPSKVPRELASAVPCCLKSSFDGLYLAKCGPA